MPARPPDTHHAPQGATAAPAAADGSFFRRTGPLLLITVLLAIPYHLRPENFIVDDGYFYLQIARNIVAGHGSTFNGWLPTNGYHPLWMLVCCGCSLLTRGTEALIQTSSIVQDLLLLVCVALLVRLSGPARLLSLAFGCTVFWFMGEVLGIWRLLESYLSVALQLTVLTVVIAAPRTKATALRPIGIGLLLGLTLLARLDLLFFVATVLLWQWFRSRDPYSIRARTAALQLAAACCLVLPYLAWNLRNFGHLVPVSGAIKSTFPHLHGITHLTPDIFLVGAGTALNLLLLRKRQRSTLQDTALVSALASAVYLTYALCFTEIWPWYLTTGTITLACLGVRLGEALLRRLPLAAGGQVAAVSAIAALLFFPAFTRTRTNLSMTRVLISHTVSLRTPSGEEPRKHLALELARRLPADARIFTFDTPGSLAYYSGLSVTPADGLVCDYGYSADLLRAGFASYARQHGLRYFVMPQVASGQQYSWLEVAGARQGDTETIQVYAPMRHKPAGTVDLPDSALLFTAPTIQPGFERAIPTVGVWQLPPRQ